MIFEDENSGNRGETTCLGKGTNEHQKAFTDLLGAHTSMISYTVQYHSMISYDHILSNVMIYCLISYYDM